MTSEIITTADGSSSIAIPELGVTYHSTHGALQESKHVFIEAGLQYILSNTTEGTRINILEMGFGTGLNALLTMAAARQNQQHIYYETLELYPLDEKLYSMLNYSDQLQQPDLQPLFQKLHTCEWNSPIPITAFFTFKKNRVSLVDFSTKELFNCIYFDAFAPDVQPMLWTTEVFRKLYTFMAEGGALTTYCSKSIVRKAMTAAGLTVQKIPGPPHKREMVRAIK